MRFTRRKGVLEARVDRVEARALSNLVGDLLELLGEAGTAGADPLEALVGLSGGPVERPQDPALARLLPNAYADDAPEAAAEFRRFTEADLREGKRVSARTVLALLEPALSGGGRLTLDDAQAAALLGTLNDLRLVLGTRLEVTEDMEALPPQDPRAPALNLYGWLGWLQESLLSRL